MEKINVGFIGCGRISDMHFPAYKDNKEARLYAVCDSNPVVAEARKNEWGAVKSYTDYKEMLADPDLDAIEIITPHDLHEPMVIAAAEAKKHIAVQKPMTISLASADRMIAAAKKAGIIYKVTDNYVHYPPIVMAKKMIEDGVIGEPQMLRMKMISSPKGGWEIAAESYNWRLKEFAEGRFSETFDHGHHEWATAWYLLGDFDKTFAWIDSLDGMLDNPATMIWKYKNSKSYGVCEFNYSSDLFIPSKYYSNDEWFEITGSKGLIHIRRCTGLLNEGPILSIFTDEGWKHISDIKDDWVDGFTGSAHNFIKAIRGEEEPFLTGEQGKDILQFTFAILKSAKIGREVYVDEMEKRFPSLYAWKRRKKEIKTNFSNTKKLKGGGSKFSKYASQAKELTLNAVNNFNPEEVHGWETVIGLHLTPDGGVGEMKMGFYIKDSKIELRDGELPDNRRFTLITPAGTWAAILLGKKKLEMAAFQGQIKMDGQVTDGLRMRSALRI